MTNKPMLSVERELLGKAASLLEIHSDRPSLETCVADDLRAILDKPDTPYVPKRDWSFDYIEGGDIVIRNGKDWTIIKRGDGPIYEQFLYRFCEDRMKPAAQHQGEPVAYDLEKEKANFDLEMRGTSADALLDQEDGHYINKNIRLIFVGWLLRSRYSPAKDLPAPVAVVMPDDWEDQLFAEMSRRFDLRKQIDDDHMVYDDTQVGVEFAIKWIKVRLNGAKP